MKRLSTVLLFGGLPGPGPRHRAGRPGNCRRRLCSLTRHAPAGYDLMPKDHGDEDHYRCMYRCDHGKRHYKKGHGHKYHRSYCWHYSKHRGWYKARCRLTPTHHDQGTDGRHARGDRLARRGAGGPRPRRAEPSGFLPGVYTPQHSGPTTAEVRHGMKPAAVHVRRTAATARRRRPTPVTATVTCELTAPRRYAARRIPASLSPNRRADHRFGDVLDHGQSRLTTTGPRRRRQDRTTSTATRPTPAGATTPTEPGS